MRSGVGAQRRANAAPSARHQPRNEPAVDDSRLRDPTTVTASPHRGDGQSRPAQGTARHRGPVVLGGDGEQAAAADPTLA
jgi:hypothetical protein